MRVSILREVRAHSRAHAFHVVANPPPVLLDERVREQASVVPPDFFRVIALEPHQFCAFEKCLGELGGFFPHWRPRLLWAGTVTTLLLQVPIEILCSSRSVSLAAQLFLCVDRQQSNRAIDAHDPNRVSIDHGVVGQPVLADQQAFVFGLVLGRRSGLGPAFGIPGMRLGSVDVVNWRLGRRTPIAARDRQEDASPRHPDATPHSHQP